MTFEPLATPEQKIDIFIHMVRAQKGLKDIVLGIEKKYGKKRIGDLTIQEADVVIDSLKRREGEQTV